MSDTDKPAATFAIVAYNQQDYVRDAVEGALSQSYSPLEIIISDDCSTDGTFDVISDIIAGYTGPHRIIINRNEANVGLAQNVNWIMARASGDIIVLAGGDDISLPTRTEVSVDLLRQHPSASAVIVSAAVMNASGALTGRRILATRRPRRWSRYVSWLKPIKKSAGSEHMHIMTMSSLLRWEHQTLGAGRAIRRKVAESFGPLRRECPTEDTPYLLRSLMMGYTVSWGETLLHYRRHSDNLSGADSLAHMNIGAIYKQYAEDRVLAERLGFISPGMSRRLSSWALIDHWKRSKRMGVECRDLPKFREAIASRLPMLWKCALLLDIARHRVVYIFQKTWARR
jgi:glycosyltransferase involved in cell wall biosynthesis